MSDRAPISATRRMVRIPFTDVQISEKTAALTGTGLTLFLSQAACAAANNLLPGAASETATPQATNATINTPTATLNNPLMEGLIPNNGQVTAALEASPSPTPTLNPTLNAVTETATALPTNTAIPTSTATETLVPTATATPETRFPIDRPTSADWAHNAQEAAKKWGGNPENWMKDLYQKDGQTRWDGFTWVFEGHPLQQNVVANGDGTFNDRLTGQLLTDPNKIFDFDPSKTFFEDITLDDGNQSDYASGYRGSLAPHDKGTLVYGYGTATLTDVEQAVIRRVPEEVCPPDQGAAGKFGAHKDAEAAFQNDPRVKNGENKIWIWDEQTDTFYQMDKLVIYDAAVPAEYPDTSKGASELWGGNPEQWRKDVFMKDGQVHWDGTWVFEGFPLKNGVVAQVDGVYLKPDGKTMMTEQEIYDLAAENATFTDITVQDGEYATGYRGSNAPQLAGSLDVTYDKSVLEDVEQAVIRVPTENGVCVPNPEAVAKTRANSMLADIIANANTEGGFNWNENILRMWNGTSFDVIQKP